jgi:hypothetical protein
VCSPIACGKGCAEASALLAQALGGDARVQREQRVLRWVVLTGAASSAEAAPLASSIIVWWGEVCALSCLFATHTLSSVSVAVCLTLKVIAAVDFLRWLPLCLHASSAPPLQPTPPLSLPLSLSRWDAVKLLIVTDCSCSGGCGEAQ